MSKKKKYRGFSLFHKLLIMVLGVVILVSSLMTAAYYVLSAKNIRKITQEHILQKLEDIDHVFAIEMERELDENRNLTTNPILDKFLASTNSENIIHKKVLEQAFLQHIRREDGCYAAISFLDHKGQEVIRVDRSGIRQDYRDFSNNKSSHFLGANLRESLIVENPYSDADGNLRVYIWAKKMDADSGEFRGGILVDHSLGEILEYLDHVKMFGHDPIWIFDFQQQVLKRPHETEPAFNPQPYFSGDIQRTPILSVTSEGILAYQDLAVVSMGPFLRVAITVPRSLVHQNIRSGLNFFIAVFLISICIACICALYMASRLSRPIVKLAESVKRFSKDQRMEPVNIKTSGEVQMLVDSFNQMMSDLRSADANLRSERERLDVTLKSIGDGVIATDTGGYITMINDVAVQLTGWTQEDAIGRPLGHVFQIFDEGNNQRCGDLVAKAMRLGKVIELGSGTVLVDRDGNKHIIVDSASSIRNNDEDIIGAVIVFRDETEKRKVDVEIRKLYQATEQSPNAVFITDTRGIIEYVNSMSVLLTGLERNELIGRNVYNLPDGKLFKQSPESLWDLTISYKEWTGEFMVRDERGRDSWRQVLVSAIRDKKDNVTNFLLILQDITKRKEAEIGMQKSMDYKDEFISTVSHELRAPLSISKEAVSVLSKKQTGELNEQQNNIIQIAMGNIQRMEFLINDILDISKLESGNMKLRAEVADVNLIVKENYDGWMLNAKTKEVSIDLFLPEEPLMLAVDQARLTQVFFNLISNAIKFSSEGGKIEVRIEEMEKVVKFSVKDYGVGVDRQDLSKIFEKFQQDARPYGARMKGTGLGLSIVKALIEAHGGEVNVESKEGEGATFSFTLPKQNPT